MDAPGDRSEHLLNNAEVQQANDESENYGSEAELVREESHTRSIVKGITWRVLATSTTTIIAYFVTGKVDAALQIGAFEFLAKLFIYYLHERLWLRISL